MMAAFHYIYMYKTEVCLITQVFLHIKMHTFKVVSNKDLLSTAWNYNSTIATTTLCMVYREMSWLSSLPYLTSLWCILSPLSLKKVKEMYISLSHIPNTVQVQKTRFSINSNYKTKCFSSITPCHHTDLLPLSSCNAHFSCVPLMFLSPHWCLLLQLCAVPTLDSPLPAASSLQATNSTSGHWILHRSISFFDHHFCAWSTD